MADRGLSPLVGSILLVALTVLLAATVGAMMLGVDTEDGPTTARLTAEADAAADRLSITHEGGDAIDPESLALRVRIDGQPLDRQPPVPFFSATGFVSGPTGPFNSATKGEWTAGETGSLRIATTNAPQLSTGDEVTVTVIVDDTRIATLETTAG